MGVVILVLAFFGVFVMPRLCWFLDQHLNEDTWRTRAAIGVLLACGIAIVFVQAGMWSVRVHAAVIYDLKVYCESIYGWFDPNCW